MSNHKLINDSSPGMGKWKVCSFCGMAVHGGYFWLAGFKSKIEPDCLENIDGWLDNSEEVGFDE